MSEGKILLVNRETSQSHFRISDYDAAVERQRKEKRELREKIIALKRAEKGSKKDKKKLQDEIGNET
jgi:hypothetical protein